MNMITNGATGRQPCSDMSEFACQPLCKLPIAMAYVPMQSWEKPFKENIALARGTIFPSLDLPFIGEEAVPDEKKRQ